MWYFSRGNNPYLGNILLLDICVIVLLNQPHSCGWQGVSMSGMDFPIVGHVGGKSVEHEAGHEDIGIGLRLSLISGVRVSLASVEGHVMRRHS